MVGDLVAHNFHDVVPIKAESEGDGERKNSELPDRYRCGLLCRRAGMPRAVNDSPGTDRVTHIVGAVGERGGTRGKDLDERVGVLDLVWVLLGVRVDALHALTIRCTLNTVLGGMNVVVETIESTDGDLGGKTTGRALEVVEFVEFTSAHGVVVEVAHCPSKRPLLGAELGVEFVFGHLLELLVGVLLFLDFGALEVVDSVRVGGFLNLGLLEAVGRLELLGVVVASFSIVGARWGGVFLKVKVRAVFLDDLVVGNNSLLNTIWCRAAPEKRTHEDMVPLESVVLLDDLGMEERDEEDGSEDGETTSHTKSDRGDVPGGFLVETKLWGTFVDDGKCADGTGDEEEEGRGVYGHWSRVTAHMDGDFDEHENASAEASGNSGSHGETSKDGTETLALVLS